MDSAIGPVPHSEELPIPVFEGLPRLESALSRADDLSSTDSETTIADNDFPPSLLPPQLFSQNELNDLARDLNLSIVLIPEPELVHCPSWINCSKFVCSFAISCLMLLR